MFFEEEENSVSDLVSDISPSKRVSLIKVKRKRTHSNDEDKRALKDIETPSKEQDLNHKKEPVRPNFITRLNSKRMRILSPGTTAESNNNTKEKSPTKPLSELPQKSPPLPPPEPSLELLPVLPGPLGDSESKDSHGVSTSVTQSVATAGDPAALSDREELLADILGIIADSEVKEVSSSSVLVPSVEKSSLEESIDLKKSDLPIIYNFKLFEQEVYQDIKVFDQVEEIEKHDHSMVESRLPTPCRKQKKQGGGKMLYECKICSKVFMQLSEFTEHERNHQKDIICDICGKEQRSASHLLNHRTHHHPDLREKPCEVCRKVSCQCEGGGGGGGTVMSGKIRSFCCKSCGTVFDSKSLLVRHQITQHDMHKISKKAKVNFKHIERRKKAQQDLSRALSSSQKFRSL